MYAIVCYDSAEDKEANNKAYAVSSLTKEQSAELAVSLVKQRYWVEIFDQNGELIREFKPH
jgi:hypothetical protein